MFIMVLVGVFRHHIAKLFDSAPKTTAKAIRESQALLRSQRLRQWAGEIPHAAFVGRRQFLTAAFEKGMYLRDPTAPQETLPGFNMPNPQAGMEQMMENTRKSVIAFIPQTIIMSWISFFFSGFILSNVSFF